VHFRETEVQNFEAPAAVLLPAQKEVVRLEIAMDHTSPMYGGDTVQRLDGEFHSFEDGKSAALHELASDRVAHESFQNQKWTPLTGLSSIEQPNDVGVFECFEDVCLEPEAVGDLGDGEKLRTEDLCEATTPGCLDLIDLR
jgi:hypothetical protein